MTKYEIIFESLQDKVSIGELSMEDAQILNDIAFDKYNDEYFEEATRLAKEIHKKYIQSPENSTERDELLSKDTIDMGKQYRKLRDENAQYRKVIARNIKTLDEEKQQLDQEHDDLSNKSKTSNILKKRKYVKAMSENRDRVESIERRKKQLIKNDEKVQKIDNNQAELQKCFGKFRKDEQRGNKEKEGLI